MEVIPKPGALMRYVQMAFFALLAKTALAADPITKLAAPAKPEWVSVQADPVLTTLQADKPAKWVLVDDGPQCDLRPATDGKGATFAAKAAGHYRVLVVTDADVHRVKVVVADVPQPMPGPDNPKPPDPPKPTDPLVARLQAAYTLEPGTPADKADALANKVELYKQAVKLAADPAVTTTGELVTRVRQASDALDTDRLPGVRKVVRIELQAAMPTDVPLDAATRKLAADTFTRIKAALEAVK
jgi:hypothetical protein